MTDEARDAAVPIPIRLECPACGELHIDEGEFATKPHHTHACQSCGAVWRPAIVPTVGVRFLPGFKDDAIVRRCKCGLPTDEYGVHREPCLDHEAVLTAREKPAPHPVEASMLEILGAVGAEDAFAAARRVVREREDAKRLNAEGFRIGGLIRNALGMEPYSSALSIPEAVHRLKADLAQCKKRAEKAEALANRPCETCREERKAAEADRDDFRAGLTRWKERAEKAEAEVKRLTEYQFTMKDVRDKLRVRIAELEAEAASVLEDDDTQTASLIDEVARLRSTLIDSRNAGESASVEVARLRAALEDLEENVAAINNDISNNPEWKTSRNDVSEALSGVCADARDALRRIGEKQGEKR